MYNVEDYIAESIDSVINQTFDFNRVQLILVDDGSADSTKEIALEYQSKYPNNILVLSKENGGVASARNLGLEHAKGKYINFLDSDDKLSLNTLDEINTFFNKNNDIDIISIPMIFFERKEGFHPLSSKFKNQTIIIDLEDNFFDIQLHLSSSFIRKESIECHTFNNNVINGSDALFLNEILIIKKKYALIGLNRNVFYFYRKRFALNSIIDSSLKKDEFFTEKLKYFSQYLLNYSIDKECHVLKFIQAVVIYDLCGMAKVQELPEEWEEYKIKEFWNYFYHVLSFIDEEVILNHKAVPPLYKSFFMYSKRKDFHIVTDPEKHRVFLKSGNYNINRLKEHNIYFDYIEFKNGFLNFSGTFSSSCYPESIRIEGIKKSKNKDKEIFVAKYVDYGNAISSRRRILSIDWGYTYHFDVKIPIGKYEESKISFRVVYDENGMGELNEGHVENLVENNSVIMNNDIKFTYRSQLSDDLTPYFVKNSRIVKFKCRTFYTFPYTFSSFVKNELHLIKEILFSGEESYFSAFLFRLLYLISFIFMRNKRIWLFNDRPLYADDNGKYLFEYSIKQNDEVKKYFVLDKESEDFKTMKAISPNIIKFGSFKHKFLHIFAEKIITSHLAKPYINPFHNENLNFYSDIITSDLYFLQHGITIGDVSKQINKRSNPINLFLTSSDFERNSILDGDYNYDEEVVQLLGFPRFDYLQNKNTKKQILFAPTWRDFLWKKSPDIGEKLLLKSEYFLRLNSFLNNKKLLTTIKEKGYNLVFKPHPELINYIDLFDCNDENVIVSTKESYQDLFNESSLLITDTSSVFFDFAYLKKPVIYYQFDDNYNYDKGYFDYETMGFGDVIYSEEELVDKIIEYIENNCEMEDKYKQRVDKFFKFTDQNNCKRVYEWIYKD